MEGKTFIAFLRQVSGAAFFIIRRDFLLPNFSPSCQFFSR
jgi:hypothetical protein